MIPNITRGGRMVGLMRYLAGPGRTNEHAEPHLVTADPAIMAWHDDAELDQATATEIAQALDHPRRAFGTRVTTVVKDAEGKKRGVRDAHVWHCSLNLAADEGQLPDERWARIAEDFVEEMGFAGEAPCRWAAVRHGLSKAGNDHIHLVVALVQEDGEKASVWNDRPRAQEVCGELERRYGLEVLESRAAGRGGARGHKPAEREIADRRGGGDSARERLERVVRGAAAAAGDEAEFVRRVRRAGVIVRPRYASGRDDVVAGYSAALRPPGDQAPVWYGGGHLARDLTLPRLRAAWPDSPEAATAAVGEWTAARRGRRVVAPGREQDQPSPELWQRYADDVGALREQLRSVPVDDSATWAHVARETAGAFAAWSVAVEPEPGPLAATASQLARSAQLHAHQVRPPRPGLSSIAGVALLTASATRGGRGPVGQLALLRQLANTAQALHDAHAAVGEARTARRLADVVRGQLQQVVSGTAPSAPPTKTPAIGAEPRPPGSPLPRSLPERGSAATTPRARPSSTPDRGVER